MPKTLKTLDKTEGKPAISITCPAGLEPATVGLENRLSRRRKRVNPQTVAPVLKNAEMRKLERARPVEVIPGPALPSDPIALNSTEWGTFQHPKTNDRALLLCHASGAWNRAFEGFGVECVNVDAQNAADVRLIDRYPRGFRYIVAEPPCTHLAGSGARWWNDKGPSALLEAMSVVDACLRAVVIYSPEWWILENPVGRLSKKLGPPAWTFNPSDFAGYAPDPQLEVYTKRSCIWGNARKPAAKAVEPVLGSKMHRLPPSPDRQRLRSLTPYGFAKAVVMENIRLPLEVCA